MWVTLSMGLLVLGALRFVVVRDRHNLRVVDGQLLVRDTLVVSELLWIGTYGLYHGGCRFWRMVLRLGFGFLLDCGFPILFNQQIS